VPERKVVLIGWSMGDSSTAGVAVE
jgi:hypothetical protein